MKEIKAYIKPHKLDDVTLALHQFEGLTGMTIVDVKGFGRNRGVGRERPESELLFDFIHHIKIEIACQDDQVSEIISIIQKHAHTGLRGDGKIYVSTIDEAIRIETGETGISAL